MKILHNLRTRLGEKTTERIGTFLRFCIVGVIAAAIHYGVYYLLQRWMLLNIAYTIGYLVSLLINFFLTSYFTFRKLPDVKKFIGFGTSHAINYFLHIILFNFYLYVGISHYWAPIVVIATVVPINFLLLQWVFTHHSR